MKNINQKAGVWLQLITFVAIWVAVLYFTNTELLINWASIKKLPHVVTVYMALYFIFTKWAWRFRLFQGWLVPFPDLQGTWEGQILTTWQDPERGVIPPPISGTLVIRQSFDVINCILYTGESESHSNAALLATDGETGITRLSFNYTNRPRVSVRDRSGIHDGAALLRILTGSSLELQGEYWTTRKTTGEMRFVFKSRQ